MRHALVAIVGAFLTASLFGAGPAYGQAICAPADEVGISRCTDGSWEQVDDRGHLLVFDADGTLRLDLAPDQPWY